MIKVLKKALKSFLKIKKNLLTYYLLFKIKEQKSLARLVVLMPTLDFDLLKGGTWKRLQEATRLKEFIYHQLLNFCFSKHSF